MADEQGRVATDRYKLLPCDGVYKALINGEECECEVSGGVLQQQRCFSKEIKIELL